MVILVIIKHLEKWKINLNNKNFILLVTLIYMKNIILIQKININLDRTNLVINMIKFLALIQKNVIIIIKIIFKNVYYFFIKNKIKELIKLIN